MTPDTAEFPKDAAWPSAKPWTEDEDGIIEAVSHLPHSRLRVTVINQPSISLNPRVESVNPTLPVNFPLPTSSARSRSRSSRLKALNLPAGLERLKRRDNGYLKSLEKRVWARSEVIDELRPSCRKRICQTWRIIWRG
jgi:hypothetical protein